MLNVLMIAAENAALPKGKVGGVGDVIRDIPQFLARENIKVSVLTPGYRYHSINNPSKLVHTFKVPFESRLESVELYQLNIKGEKNVTQWVVEHDLFANAGKGIIYCDDGSTRPFASDASKFALFGSAVCELLIDYWKDHFNVIHLHDWHAAFVAILRAFEPKYAALKSLHTVYSIHNLGIQGIRPLTADPSSLKTWYPNLKYDISKIGDPRYPDCVNPARAGINLSDRIHAVSPTYASEIVKQSDPQKDTVGGEGLHLDLQKVASEKRLFGILNGCDYSDKSSSLPELKYTEQKLLHSDSPLLSNLLQQTNDALMSLIAQSHFVRGSHYVALEHLRNWQKLIRTSFAGPLVTSVGRLTEQKVKLLLLPFGSQKVLDHLLNRLAEYQGILIAVGSGDPMIETAFTQAMINHENFLFINGFCEGLPDQLYELGDLFLMPSSMEPCGISQMLAMRCGQPCLVHQTGGLKDTVEHLKTGFSFAGDNNSQRIESLVAAFDEAMNIYANDKKRWHKITSNALNKKFLWQDSVKAYISQLYQFD